MDPPPETTLLNWTLERNSERGSGDTDNDDKVELVELNFLVAVVTSKNSGSSPARSPRVAFRETVEVNFESSPSSPVFHLLIK